MMPVNPCRYNKRPKKEKKKKENPMFSFSGECFGAPLRLSGEVCVTLTIDKVALLGPVSLLAVGECLLPEVTHYLSPHT